MRDLLIAGGGPVGLATALHAVRAGLDVTVWEPRAGVVDKACGEGLMPGAVAALARLGVEPAGVPLTGIRYVDTRGSVTADFRAGPGRGVARTELHRALREAVDAAGVRVEERAVRDLVQHDDHVWVEGVEVDGTAARHVVGADGLHSSVRRLAGLDAAGDADTRRRYGQRMHLHRVPWTSHVEVHWSGVGEAYVTPVAPDRVGVAVLSSERRPLADLLGAFPTLAGRLTGAAGRPRGAGPLRQRSRARVAGRVLLVGDAAGYVDALTGEGLALGVAQAEAVVEAVAADRADTWDRTWRRLTRRHDLLTAGLLRATRPAVTRSRVVGAARRAPWAFGWAVDQLARPA